MMSSLDSVGLLAAVGAASGAALAGWVLGARRARRGQPPMWASGTWRSAVTAFVVVSSVAAAAKAPVIAVFWLLIALNFVLGRDEYVPFSNYSMFSRPPTTSWALSFEDANGELIPIRQMGISPHTQKKRFETELRAARDRGITDLSEARRRAAEVLAVEIEAHRRRGGRWAATPITISLIEHSYESGTLVTVRTPLMETRPR